MTEPRQYRRNLKRAGWWVMLILAVGVAGYAAMLVLNGVDNYPGGLAASFQARPWGFYPHAGFGLIALLLGPLQFHMGFREKRLSLHRGLGKVYIVAGMLSAAAGLYMAFYSFGGWITNTGFGGMATCTLVATALAYVKIRNGNIRSHRNWMTRSYALFFSAVTLRIWLPLLTMAFGGDFEPAYQVVAWVSWVPNLMVAEWIIRRYPPFATSQQLQEVLDARLASTQPLTEA